MFRSTSVHRQTLGLCTNEGEAAVVLVLVLVLN